MPGSVHYYHVSCIIPNTYTIMYAVKQYYIHSTLHNSIGYVSYTDTVVVLTCSKFLYRSLSHYHDYIKINRQNLPVD